MNSEFDTSLADPQRGQWKLRDVLAGLFIGEFVAFAAVTVYLSITGQSSSKATLGVSVASLVGLWCGLAGVPLWVSRTRGTGRFRKDFGLQFDFPNDAALGLTIGVFIQFCVVPALYLPLAIFDHSAYRKLSDPARQVTDLASHGPGFVLLAFLLVVAAPVVEEVFFRGLTLGALRRRWGPVVAVVVSAGLFALVHFELLQLPALFVFGLVTGTIAHRTGRLGINVWTHVGFNAATVIVLSLSK